MVDRSQPALHRGADLRDTAFRRSRVALGWRLDAVAFGIFVLHIARFFADFMLTYGFYYPPWGVPGTERAATQTAF